MSAKTRHVYAEEAEFLLDGGREPSDVVDALGLKPGALARALHRHDRNDLARPFWSLDNAERRRQR